MTTYRIRNWEQHFENNRTREMVKMAWVPVPNKHDGEGFQRIMREPDGLILYGCWHLILQVASKCLRERGTLMRDDGTPLDAEAIALKTGCRDSKAIQRALDFLSSSAVAWIEALTENGQVIPQEGAPIPQEGARKGIEGNGIEGNGNKTPAQARVTQPYGEFKKVKLTDEEYQKLVTAHGKEKANKGIDLLDAYIESKGKRYRNHYAVLKENSWVWERLGKSDEGHVNGKSWTNFGRGGL